MAVHLRIVTVFFLASGTTSFVLAAQPPAPEPLRTLTGHAEAVRSVAFSADGKTLASGSFDKTVKLWDVATGQEQATFRGYGEAHVAAADVRPGINSLAFTPDGKILATSGLDASIKLWDVAAKKELHTLTGHSDRVLSIAMAPDGKTLASASEDRSLRIWEIDTGKQQSALFDNNGAVSSVAFADGGRTLISGASDGAIKLWDSAERRAIVLRMWKNVLSVGSSSDRKSMAAGMDGGEVTLWYLQQNLVRRVLEGHQAAVFAVTFSPDSQTLATASLDGTVKLWDVVYRPASGQRGCAREWNVDSGVLARWRAAGQRR